MNTHCHFFAQNHFNQMFVERKRFLIPDDLVTYFKHLLGPIILLNTNSLTRFILRTPC